MQVQLSQSSIIIPATESSVSETLVGRKSDKILHECNKHLRSSMVQPSFLFLFLMPLLEIQDAHDETKHKRYFSRNVSIINRL